MKKCCDQDIVILGCKKYLDYLRTIGTEWKRFLVKIDIQSWVLKTVGSNKF